MDPSSADVLFQVVWWCDCLESQNWKRKLIQGDLHLPADFSSGGSASLAGKIWPEEVPLTLVVTILMGQKDHSVLGNNFYCW